MGKLFGLAFTLDCHINSQKDVYIYIDTSTHIHTHVHTHLHTYLYASTYIFTYIYTYSPTYILIYKHTYICTGPPLLLLLMCMAHVCGCVCVGMCPGMCVAVCWRVCGHTDVYKRVSAAVAEWMASTPLISPALAECEACNWCEQQMRIQWLPQLLPGGWKKVLFIRSAHAFTCTCACVCTGDLAVSVAFLLAATPCLTARKSNP